ncbi:MAG: metallophosphoesterase [Oscillospiraceae bacterium]|nr:metallophosphoesterase [Oscillibacter sp.]MBQ9968313.1 metallophosphoesterase [Oscillospiraceae bacterium]
MIRFLHAADLHLDSPFAEFSPRQAAEQRQLQRRLLRDLLSLCRRRACDLLLLAGDIFDGMPYPETIELLRRELSLCPVPVFLVPGNHDPLDSGIWDGGWPEQVHIFRAPGAVELEDLGVCIHHGDGAELRAPRDGYLHIGLIHGDIPLSMEQIAATGLDYLAMGHIHKAALPRKSGETWYGWPGVPMGRGFDETGKKGVFFVELSREGCRTEQIFFETPRYETFTVAAGEPWEPPYDCGQIRGRLRVVGQGDPLWAKGLYRALAPQFLSLELVDETAPSRDLWADCGERSLRGLALDALRAHPDQELAPLAAKLLLAALEGRDAPW